MRAGRNDAAWSDIGAKVLIRIKDADQHKARRLVVEGIDIMKRLEHEGALGTPR